MTHLDVGTIVKHPKYGIGIITQQKFWGHLIKFICLPGNTYVHYTEELEVISSV